MLSSLVDFKLYISLVILLLTIISGLYPFIQRIKNEAHFNFTTAEALAGGIFFGAGLLHMLGNATTNFISLGYSYPWPFLITGGVFLLLLCLEQISHRSLVVHTSNDNFFVMMAVLMISIHSLFEGAALGLSNHLKITIVIACAIIAHKWAASFALAVQINKYLPNLKIGVIYFSIFALMTPIGIILGDLISLQLAYYKLVQPICDALAAGTFLYLGSLHGLSRAVMVEKCGQIRNLNYVFLGFSAMAIVAAWV